MLTNELVDEHHMLRLPRHLGHSDRMEVDMLRSGGMWWGAERPHHGLGTRDLYGRQRRARDRDRDHERDGVRLPSLAAVDRLAAD
jgi:hypothetical protein